MTLCARQLIRYSYIEENAPDFDKQPRVAKSPHALVKESESQEKSQKKNNDRRMAILITNEKCKENLRVFVRNVQDYVWVTSRNNARVWAGLFGGKWAKKK